MIPISFVQLHESREHDHLQAIVKVSAKLSNAIVSRMVQEGILKFSKNGKQKLVVRDEVTTKIYEDLSRKYNKPSTDEYLSQLPTPESKSQFQTTLSSETLQRRFHDVLQVSRSDLQMQTNSTMTSSKQRSGGDSKSSQISAKIDPKKLSGEFYLQSSQGGGKSSVPSTQMTSEQDSSAFQQARDKLGESSYEPFAVPAAENSKKSFHKAGQKQRRDDSPELSCSQNALLNDDSVSLPAQPMFQSRRPRLQMSQ